MSSHDGQDDYPDYPEASSPEPAPAVTVSVTDEAPPSPPSPMALAPTPEPAAPATASPHPPNPPKPSLLSQALSLSDATLRAKVKAPKLVVGPLEVGWKLVYTLKDEAAGLDSTVPLHSKKRIVAVTSVKDVWLRGKLEVEPGKQQARYSKKFRLPWLNTGLAKLAVTADWSAASSGVLGRMLGLQLHWQHQSLVASSVVRKSPDYAINVQPRLTLPSFGVPASLAVKAAATVHVSDAPELRDVRGKVEVQDISLVMRMYDVHKVKPNQVSRRLADLAWKPLSGSGAVAASSAAAATPAAAPKAEKKKAPSKAKPPAASSSAAPAPATALSSLPTKDAIDVASAKAREWAHAVLVGSCVATKHLERQLAQWRAEYSAFASRSGAGGKA